MRGAQPGKINAPPAIPCVFDNWSQALPYDHRVANADTVPLHYVVAEWLGRWKADAPALPDSPSRRLIKERPTCRVYQITLGPGKATDAHIHTAPGLTVQGNGGVLTENVRLTAKGGNGPGSWSGTRQPITMCYATTDQPR